MSQHLAIGLARTTFDMAYAGARWDAAQSLLSVEKFEIWPNLLTEPAHLDALLEAQEAPKQLLVFQATFSDAAMLSALAEAWPDTRLVVWAPREPLTGGRLRLNAFCGLNLASHALSRRQRPLVSLLQDPEAPEAAQRLREALAQAPEAPKPLPQLDREGDPSLAQPLVDALAEMRIGLVGEHPPGFDTCRFDPDWLGEKLGVQVVARDLPTLFETARAVEEGRLDALEADTAAHLLNYQDLEPETSRKTLSLYVALKDWVEAEKLSSLAVRCWPETFTDYGCAACGAMARLGGEGTPSACEADVVGSLSSQILALLGDLPPFLVDLVDYEAESGRMAVWHCGLAPLQLCAPGVQARAALHSNRQKPLLHEFPLRPGLVTLFRISFGWETPKLVVGTGHMLDAPLPFGGTAGLMQLSQPGAGQVVLDEGVEHHLALAYGDLRPALRALAIRLGLPLLDLDS